MPLIATYPKPHAVLGLLTFGPDPTGGARITSLPEFTKVLDVYQSRGYHEVDTARSYGNGTQEAFTRSAGWKERGLTLATKSLPEGPGGHSAANLPEKVETSLRELGTDCVDIFYLHTADRSVPFAETLEAVDKLHKAGKFVRFGISNFAAFEVAEIVVTCEQHGWVRPTIYQGMYNALTRSAEAELFPALRRYGIAFYAYNPLAAGIFSGKYTSEADQPEEGRFSNVDSKRGERYRERYFRHGVFEALKIVRSVTEGEGLTLVEVALRWLVHHSGLKIVDGGQDAVILGVSSLAQLEQNLDAMEAGPLPEAVIKVLDEAWKNVGPESTDYWIGKLEYGYDTRKALFNI
ncbi:hypothetical protein V496_07871 [Pseudogymnoascus sp. VKM F-4515 (FW-2607)]|nr:hypothetical protein V496_07871 [Pseudogymnoascus sp. VKM F-4515 (FW-2607)]